ncbi:MAG: YdbH domain-containing protein [Deltaproteobacteria bacterium]|nr:YdbH domain-containing protein [Deltaproteobacteria bacterium]MBW2418869.1 YdbH domain-containing protein [Deltaproteobacteria bacterium]
MSGRRGWAWVLLGAALIASLGLAAANRKALLERALLATLRHRGIERASLSVEDFEADRLSIAHVRIGDDDLVLRALAVRYSLGGLLDGRLDELRVEGLRIRGALEESGVSLGALDALLGDDAAPSPDRFPVLPAARIEVEEASVLLDTAEGPFVATLTVDLDAAGDGRFALAATAFPGLGTSVALEADAFVLGGSVAFRPERLQLHLEPAPFRLALAGELALADESGNLHITGTTPTLELSATPDGMASLRLATRGGELELPDTGLSLRGFELAASIDAEARLPSGRLAVQEIRDPSQEPRFPPLTFTTEFRPADERLEFEGTLEGLAGRLKLDLRGSHDPATGSGRADLALAPLQLEVDGLRPQDLLPSSAPLLQAAAGNISASGELAWDADGVSGFVNVGLRELTLQTHTAVVERINAALRVEGPWPPRTAPGQLVSMARLDFGLELTNGLVDYELRRDGVLKVESAEWQFAGGTLHAQGTLDLQADEQRLLLGVRDVDLAQLLALVNLDGLTGSGSLRGEMPVVLHGETIEIRDAVLEASSEGGWIRYSPEGEATAVASAAGMAFDDLLIALQNFRYERLSLTINGEAQGEVNVALSLHGSNPEHRDGQPYEFNMNVDGQLGDMLRQSDAAYRIPLRIEERLGEIAAGAK